MTNTTPTQHPAERDAKALVRSLTTTQLVESLLALEVAAGERRTAEQSLVRRWTIEELEDRYDTEDAMNTWADDAEDERSYVEALIAALPEGAIQ